MKILIIRTIQIDLLERLIATLQAQFSNCEISVLSNPQQAERVKGIRGVNEVFSTQRMRDFSLINIGLKNVFRIRKSSFDKLIIPHKQANLDGFGNILCFLPVLGVETWLHSSTDWKLKKVSKLKPLWLALQALLTTTIFLPFALFSFAAFMCFYALSQKRQDQSKFKTWYAGFGDI